MIALKSGPAFDEPRSLESQLQASIHYVNRDDAALSEAGILYEPSAYAELIADWVQWQLAEMFLEPSGDDPWECIK